MNALVIFGLLAVLMLSGMPISISLGLTVLTFLFTMTDVPLESVALKLFTGIEKFEIMAIPFFILAGNFLTHGGVAKRMINFAASMVGHWYGGLGLAGVLACALFAAVSGSSPATVVAIGSILLPAMVKAGFPNKFGAGVIATSGALGILIPPSIVMVMYSVATNTSVGALFMAGVIPGGRYLHRYFHADGSGSNVCGLRLYLCHFHLQGSRHEGCAEGAAEFGQHVGDAALHHHQCRSVLLHHDQRKHPAVAG